MPATATAKAQVIEQTTIERDIMDEVSAIVSQAVRKTARTDPQAAPLHESVRISTSESLPNVL